MILTKTIITDKEVEELLNVNEKIINKHHYVDKEKFSTEVTKWKEEYFKNKELGLSRPKMNNYIGDCILKIARGIAKKGNFINYTFTDEMIDFGIETVVKYLYNYNPEHLTRNGIKGDAFAYVSFMMSRAFANIIKAEAFEHYLKLKSLELLGIHENLDYEDPNDLFDDKETEASSIVSDMISKCYAFEENLKLKKKQTISKIKKDKNHYLFELFTME